MSIVVCSKCEIGYDGSKYSSVCPHTDLIEIPVTPDPSSSRNVPLSPVMAGVLAAHNVPKIALNAVLDWGEALNKMVLCKDPNEKPALEARARERGSDVQQLAMGLAALLRSKR